MIAPPTASLFLELSEESYNQWRHHPVTAAYLQFVADQAANFREAAADLFESGLLNPADAHPDRNANVLRGRILCLRELHALQLASIQEFYGAVSQEDDQA